MADLGTIHLPLRSYSVRDEGGTWVIHMQGTHGVRLPKGDTAQQEKRFFDLFEEQLQKIKASIENGGFPLKGEARTASHGLAINNSHEWELPKEFGGGKIRFQVVSHQLEGAFERPRNQRDLPIEQC